MNIALVTDAWTPQVNGVVTTLVELVRELHQGGHRVEVIHPRLFRTRTASTPESNRNRLATRPSCSTSTRSFSPKNPGCRPITTSCAMAVILPVSALPFACRGEVTLDPRHGRRWRILCWALDRFQFGTLQRNPVAPTTQSHSCDNSNRGKHQRACDHVEAGILGHGSFLPRSINCRATLQSDD